MTSDLSKKLYNPQYRKAFIASQINIGLPFQIRALLKARPELTQAKLAQRTGMRQSRISALMTPGRTRPNIETLRRIAEAFDCGLMVRFVSFSELAEWSENFEPEDFKVPSFDNDPGFLECEGRQREGSSAAIMGRLGDSGALGGAASPRPKDLAASATGAAILARRWQTDLSNAQLTAA